MARHCGVKPPSVSAWLSGDTKTIEGSNLLKAAEFLGVRPKWLSGDPPADWGEVATMLAEQVMLQLGRAPEASRDPGIDPRRDRICALIESALNARATTAERERDELKFLYANALRNSKFSSDAMDRKLSEVERERDEARAEVERKDAALRLCVARDPCLHIHPAVRAALTAKGGENADS